MWARALWQYWHLPPLPKNRVDFEGKCIEAGELVKRMWCEKEMMANKPTPQANSFKRALLVENSARAREQTEALRPPPIVPPDSDKAEEDLHLFLV